MTSDTRLAVEQCERIASLLGSAQRVAIRAIGRTKRRAIDFSGSVANGLRYNTSRRPPLVGRSIAHDHGRRIAHYWLTADGLAVLAALTSEVRHDDQ